MYDAALTSGMLYRAIDVNNKENFKKIFYYYEELLVVKNFPNIVSSFTNLTKDEKKLYTESFWNMVMSQEKSAITLIDQIEKDGF
jgi:DNA replication initiation complex subunit (GINS family)